MSNEVMVVPEKNREAAEGYRDLLRQMKKDGLKVEDMPDQIAQAMLRLHQNWQLVWYADRINEGRFNRKEPITWPE